MSMTRILQCVLVVLVLAITGCSDRSTTSTEKPANNPPRNNASPKTPPSAQSAQNVNDANKPSQEGNSSAQSNSNASDQNDDQPSSSNQNQKAPEQSQKESNPTPTETFPSSVMDWIIRGLGLAGGLLVLTLVGMALLRLRNRSRHNLEHHLTKAAAAQVSVTRDAQKEILDKLSTLSSAQSETNSRLHDVHTEVRSLARLVRESSLNRGDGRSYSSLASSYVQNEPLPKEEPEFPVSANDYLGKMIRFANVVKPDFQNGILISDPDGTGELMLIRDSRLPDETQPLFVVPRHAQFQTKQDFYTYYEKYYDCVRPSAGDVWIIDPAVVERVSGGWQLREKGVLEIR